MPQIIDFHKHLYDGIIHGENALSCDELSCAFTEDGSSETSKVVNARYL